jgi:hypothetical protein
MSIECSVDVGREKLHFNTGYLAKQADGAVAVSYGEVIVFASAVASRDIKEGQDFFPLTVDYRRKDTRRFHQARIAAERQGGADEQAHGQAAPAPIP